MASHWTGNGGSRTFPRPFLVIRRANIPNLNQRKLKIAISIWTFAPNTGGLQAHARLLCHNLQKLGHDVTVITRSATRVPQGRDYLFFNEPYAPIEVDGIPVVPLRISKNWKPVLWAILKLAANKPTLPLAARLYETVAA